MHDTYYKTPVFDDVAGCSAVCVTYEISRETLLALDRKVNGPSRSHPASLYSRGYKALDPLYNKNEKVLSLINSTIESEGIVRNLMMCTQMMRNGLTYLTFIYKLKKQLNLTYSTPSTKKFWHVLEPSPALNDCTTLTSNLKQLSERIIRGLDIAIKDKPVFCAEIVSNTNEDYFNDEAETITPSSIIHRGKNQVEMHCIEFEQGTRSAFYIPVWERLPFFGFFVQSGNATDTLLTDRFGIELFSAGPYLCMSFYEKVNQDFREVETGVSIFLNKKNPTDLESLTFISSLSDELHAVSEKISILSATSDEQFFQASYTNLFKSKLQDLQNRANELQSFIRARHPLKEGILQVKQIKSNRTFSIMFASLAGVQIIIALISVDWTDSTLGNNIYKNGAAIYELIGNFLS